MAVIRGGNRSLAENPPYGAAFYYTLPADPKGEVTLDISGPDGRPVARFSSDRDPTPHPTEIFHMTAQPSGDKKLTRRSGMNRFVWDLRLPSWTSSRTRSSGGSPEARPRYRATTRRRSPSAAAARRSLFESSRTRGCR